MEDGRREATLDEAVTSISMVIRCLNEEQHIGRLLAGLERQSRRPNEIVIVDSGSTDATLDIAARYDTKIVHIKPQEFSFGRALNVGCAAATGDVLVFASAHVYPLYDSYLDLLTAPFADPRVALTYGRQVGDQRTKYSEARVLLQWFPETSIRRQQHPFCNNANAAVRREIWEVVPYDESLTGLEDLDWARRVQAKGFDISYVAEAPVAHVHEETWRTVVNRYRREAIAYKRIMGDEANVSGLESARLAVTNTLRDYVQASREGVLTSNLVEIPKFRIAQFLGAWQGFRQGDVVSEGLKRRFYYPPSPGAVDVPKLPGNPIVYKDLEQSSRPAETSE
jgi:rhamnosyltransferase